MMKNWKRVYVHKPFREKATFKYLESAVHLYVLEIVYMQKKVIGTENTVTTIQIQIVC